MACPAGFGGAGTKPGVPPPGHPALRLSSTDKPVAPEEHHWNFSDGAPIAEPVELRKIGEEYIYLLGGQFAIVCQFAHPGLAEGSYKHSNFAYRVLDRLKTTTRFMNAAVYGTPEEKEAIFGVIHRKHADIRGEGYSADDPELHKWTAATLFVSLVKVHECFFGKIPREKEEVYFREFAVYGTSLRMPPDMWPATLDDFWSYWDHNVATLEITDWARSLATDILFPKKMPIWIQPLTPVTRMFAIQWLPERFQREFGFYDKYITPVRTGVYHLMAGYGSLVYPILPKAIRAAPSRYYKKDLKKAVQAVKETGDWTHEKEKLKEREKLMKG